MRRAALIVCLVLFTFDVSGLAALSGDEDCGENCPTDASGGHCPPNCHFCSGCCLPKVIAPASTTLQEPAARVPTWAVMSAGPPSPSPADIMHVPKFVLA